jgi:hypothetical protein
VAILISKTSFTHHWGVTQMAGHGWGGVVNLAGVPYACLFIEDLDGVENIGEFDCLIFGQCNYLTETDYEVLLHTLDTYLNLGGNLIIDGTLGFYDEKARERDHSALDERLNLKYDGFKGNDTYRIRVLDNSHFITKNFEKLQYITQHLVNGLNIQSFEDVSRVLLEMTDENKTFPFLSVKAGEKNRLVLVNDFSTWSGVPSFFRNNQPQVFYKNQIFNVLIQTLYWSIYGDTEQPVPSLQVSNANMTAIIRLDGDASGNLDAQIRTINYLIDIATETGVVPLYTWVSSAATKAGWQDLAPLGKKMEDAGGVIGTHSRFHRIDQEMNEKRWQEELDEAIKEIEFNMSDYGYDIGKVDCFINPGNTIRMNDYDEVAKRFGFYMTHGFEQDMPIGFGNFTWFNEKYKNFVILENTPSPDYQWFYDPTWSYTTAQITAYEESIFNHMYSGLGHGVIFNEMWHDYSITTQPQYGKDRIVNKSNIALYDALKAKFRTHDIYCPDPYDLQNKLILIAQGQYTWQAKDNIIEFDLDLSGIEPENVRDYTGSMGLRINNTVQKIQQVYIDDKEYFAFSDQVVILPNLAQSKTHIRIILGMEPFPTAHLSFVSKRMPSIEKSGETLSVKLLTKSRAKFTFNAGFGDILLNADGYEWERNGKNELKGFVRSDRTVQLKTLATKRLMVTFTDVTISAVEEKKEEVVLHLFGKTESRRQLRLISNDEIQIVLLNGEDVDIRREGENYILDLNLQKESNELIINY